MSFNLAWSRFGYNCNFNFIAAWWTQYVKFEIKWFCKNGCTTFLYFLLVIILSHNWCSGNSVILWNSNYLLVTVLCNHTVSLNCILFIKLPKSKTFCQQSFLSVYFSKLRKVICTCAEQPILEESTLTETGSGKCNIRANHINSKRVISVLCVLIRCLSIHIRCFSLPKISVHRVAHCHQMAYNSLLHIICQTLHLFPTHYHRFSGLSVLPQK